MNISYSFGMVDLVHYGHIRALKRAYENSDLHIFGLVSDEASDAWFGGHVSNEDERKTVLEGIKYIDEIWFQATFDPLDNLRIIHNKYPDACISLFTGNEWGILSAKRYVESIGGKIVKLDYYEKLSPQSILDTLIKNETRSHPLNSNLISTKGRFQTLYLLFCNFSHVFLAMFLFLLLKLLFSFISYSNPLKKALNNTDKYSYEIYLVHHFIILGPFSLLLFPSTYSKYNLNYSWNCDYGFCIKTVRNIAFRTMIPEQREVECLLIIEEKK